MNKINYLKYRWFFTSTGKLVVGGKSAEQNEKLVNGVICSGKTYIAMHTRMPGSPFSFIISDVKDVSENDLEGTAIFTACFSRAWRERKKETLVDIFQSKQIMKSKKMKSGSFGILGKIKRKKVKLILVLDVQKGKVRFVPEQTLANEEKKPKEIIKIIPGKISKEQVAEQISKIIKKDKNEVLNALPTGEFEICHQ